MRPNVDIDWENHGRIKSLAEGRYGGDLDKAYNAVLKRGLQYSAIPSESQLERGDPGSPIFIPTENEGEPILFDQFLSQLPNPYSAGHGPYTTYTIDEFEEALSTISRYSNVDFEEAAFGIRRSGGNWSGWGFGNLIATLREPIKRYQQTEFDELAQEEVGLAFSIGGDYVVIRARHLPDDKMLGNLHLDILLNGTPTRIDSALEAVIGEFNARLINATELGQADYTEVIQDSTPVEPLDFLTYSEREHDWVNRIIIENPFDSGKLTADLPNIMDPKEMVVHLRDHLLAEEAKSAKYIINRSTVIMDGVLNVSIVGGWKMT